MAQMLLVTLQMYLESIYFLFVRGMNTKNNSSNLFGEGFLNYMTKRSYHFNPELKSVENTQF